MDEIIRVLQAPNSACPGLFFWLLNASYQAGILIGVIWLGLRIFRIKPAPARFYLWLFALLGVALLPAINPYLPHLRPLWVLQRPAEMPPMEFVEFYPPPVSEVTPEVTDYEPILAEEPVEFEPPEAAPIEIMPTKESPWPKIKEYWPLALTAAWILGAVFFLARLLCGHLAIRRLKSDAREVASASVLQTARETAAKIGLKRNMRLLASSDVSQPATAGIFRPAVILPEEFIRSAGADELKPILIHEFAHIKRSDFLVNLFQRLLEAVFFFHPLIWIASRNLRLTREEICDNWVLEITGERKSYARSLAHFAQVLSARRLPATVALIHRRPEILRRIEMILDERRKIATRLSKKAALLILLTFAFFFPLISAFPFIGEAPAAAEAERVEKAPESTMEVGTAVSPATQAEEELIRPIPDSEIKMLLLRHPQDAQIHLAAAFLFGERENKAQARERAIRLAPEYRKVFLVRDLELVPLEKFDGETLQKLAELVRIDPGNAWPHYILAGHYLKKGEKEKWLKEVDAALSKPRLDDYELQSLRAVFRLLDEINQPFKAVWKISIFSGTLLRHLSPARNSAQTLMNIGKELDEKGEKVQALEYYKKAERLGEQLLLRRPDIFMIRLVSNDIRKNAYKEMVRIYEEEGRAQEAVALRKQIDLMDAWMNDLRAISRRSEPLYQGVFLTQFKANMEEIRPEKREEISAKVNDFKNEVGRFLESPAFTHEVEAYLERIFNEGEFQAKKALAEPEKSPLATDLAEISKQYETLQKEIDEALIRGDVFTQRECLANLKQIGLALHLYAHDYGKFYPPPAAGLKALVPRYMPEAAFSKCSYEYNRRQLKPEDPPTTPLAWDKKDNHPDGRNVLFVDGHGEWMPEEKFQELLSKEAAEKKPEEEKSLSEAAAESRVSVEDILAALKYKESLVRDFSCHYRKTCKEFFAVTDHSQPVDSTTGGLRRLPEDEQPIRYHRHFWAERGPKVRWDHEVLNSASEVARREKAAFDGEILTAWSSQHNEGVIEPDKRVLQSFDGLGRYFLHDKWFRPYSEMGTDKERQEEVRLRKDQEVVGGRPCYVLEEYRRGRLEHTLYVDCERFIPVKFCRWFSFKEGLLWHSCEILETVELPDGIWFPTKIAQLTYVIAPGQYQGQLNVRSTIVVDRESIKVNSGLPDDLFRITFEPGTEIHDNIAGTTYEYKAAGEKEPEKAAEAWILLQARIDGQVQMLREESLEQSLAKLGEIEMYYWPGSPEGLLLLELPLRSSAGQWEVKTVMSNRRFLKVLHEVSLLPSSQAAALVKREIEATLATCRAFFENYIESNSNLLKPDAKPDVFPSFLISNNPDGSPTFLGSRFQVLALLLVAGNTGLQETGPAVLAVAQEAEKQRRLLYNTDEFNEGAASAMLLTGSLYNRQILATALVGTCMNPDETEEVLRELGLKWKNKKLTHFDASVTPYDLHGRMGNVPVDYSKGELTVRYLNALNDTDFDIIMERAMLTEREERRPPFTPAAPSHRILEKISEEQVSEQIELAKKFIEKQEFDKAEAILNAILMQDPTEQRALVLLEVVRTEKHLHKVAKLRKEAAEKLEEILKGIEFRQAKIKSGRVELVESAFFNGEKHDYEHFSRYIFSGEKRFCQAREKERGRERLYKLLFDGENTTLITTGSASDHPQVDIWPYKHIEIHSNSNAPWLVHSWVDTFDGFKKRGLLSFVKETDLDGEPCYLLEGSGNNSPWRFWISKDKDFALVRQDIIHEGALKIRWQMSDFRHINGIWLAHKIIDRRPPKREEEGKVVTEEYIIEVKEAAFNIPIPEETFKIEIEEGSMVQVYSPEDPRDVVETFRYHRPAVEKVPQKALSTEDAAVKEKLQQLITFHFIDTPFGDVMDFVRVVGDINIALDPQVVTKEMLLKPVTLKLENVTVESALWHTLRFLDLRFVVKDGVVFISHRFEVMGEPKQAVYDVRDVLAVIEDFEAPKLGVVEPEEEKAPLVLSEEERKKKVDEEGEKLAKLIVDTIEPGIWWLFKENYVRYRDGQLIIKAPDPIHIKIQEFLGNLRKARGLHVQLDLRFIRAAPGFLEEAEKELKLELSPIAGVVSPPAEERPVPSGMREEDLKALLGRVRKSEKAKIMTAPRVTLFNTQRGYVATIEEDDYIFDIRPVKSAEGEIEKTEEIKKKVRTGVVFDVRTTISADRRDVLMDMYFGHVDIIGFGEITTETGQTIEIPALGVINIKTTLKVPDGETMVMGGLRYTLEEGEEDALTQFLLLVTPHIIIQEEGERVLKAE